MKILVGKTFGIGNLVMAIPMLKALRKINPTRIDLLIGTTPDDSGAYEIARKLVEHHIIDGIWLDVAWGQRYDVAIMSIPFDGRWRNNAHFYADRVIDGRTRPDPNTTGLVSWEKHEVLYQMDNAISLGYSGPVPSMEFFEVSPPREDIDFQDTVYIGLGYKRDLAGFWKFKHWGNENYTQLVNMLTEQGLKCVCTGNLLDLQQTVRPIMEKAPLRYIATTTLQQSFEVVAGCHMYVGNDTGMMHIAASRDNLVAGIFMDKKLLTKNHPWTSTWSGISGWTPDAGSPEGVFTEVMALRARRF